MEWTDLKLLMRFRNQDVRDGQVVDVTMPFKLLSDLGPDCGNWVVDAVHRLDLWCLYRRTHVSIQLILQYFTGLRGNHSQRLRHEEGWAVDGWVKGWRERW